MVTGARALGLVREELFATIEEAEAHLERFIVERHCSSLLQRAVESICQIRGALTLIGLSGAQLLAHETLQLATDIPAGAGAEHDEHLMALCHALHVLRRYLEQLRSDQSEMPELLLPAINTLRLAGGQPELPESFFFSVRLDQRPPLCSDLRLAQRDRQQQARRMRQMYQIGLVGFLRDIHPAASVKLMSRALERCARLLQDHVGAPLPWVAAAALEPLSSGAVTATRPRKLLFARIDRELRQMLANEIHEPPRSVLKELLYLLALGGADSDAAHQVMEIYAIEPLSFTDAQLQAGKQRLAGPGHAVLNSLATAIGEELETVKDLVDLIEGDLRSERDPILTGLADNLPRLYVQVGILGKTLGMVEQEDASQLLQACLPQIQIWREKGVTLEQLMPLADTLVLVENLVCHLDAPIPERAVPAAPEQARRAVANQQLSEAQALLRDQARNGIAEAKRAIGAFLNSRDDCLHLAAVPGLLDTVRGALFFLGSPRAAELTQACAAYVQNCLMEAKTPNEPQALEVLADALSSIEFFIESHLVERPDGAADILDIAAQSIRALGWTSAAA